MTTIAQIYEGMIFQKQSVFLVKISMRCEIAEMVKLSVFLVKIGVRFEIDDRVVFILFPKYGILLIFGDIHVGYGFN